MFKYSHGMVCSGGANWWQEYKLSTGRRLHRSQVAPGTCKVRIPRQLRVARRRCRCRPGGRETEAFRSWPGACTRLQIPAFAPIFDPDVVVASVHHLNAPFVSGPSRAVAGGDRLDRLCRPYGIEASRGALPAGLPVVDE